MVKIFNSIQLNNYKSGAPDSEHKNITTIPEY